MIKIAPNVIKQQIILRVTKRHEVTKKSRRKKLKANEKAV